MYIMIMYTVYTIHRMQYIQCMYVMYTVNWTTMWNIPDEEYSR